MSWSRRAVLAASALTGLAGCLGTSAPKDESEPTGTPGRQPAGATYAYTHLQPSGNRRLSASGAVVAATPVELDVDGTPAWLLAFGGESSDWTVVTDDGTATTHEVSGGTSQKQTDHGRVATPPLAYRMGETVEFVEHPADCAAYTHPVPDGEKLLYVAADGDVVVWQNGDTTRLNAAAPLDARLVSVGDRRYALYGGQTDRYRHGALGDTTEGSRLLVVDADRERIETAVELDEPTVFEGLSPLVADLNDDGEPELVTTIADSADGARIRAYDTDGTELATGRIYGPGWRHQLAVAPFAPGGRPELAVVRKPHVDRTAEFYRLAGGELAVTAGQEGYASHTYGSRNLDQAVAAELDGDGRTELLVPTTNRQRLEAVQRTDSGAETAWSLSLDGALSTNVAGVALDDGLAVGAGTAAGVRVWQG